MSELSDYVKNNSRFLKLGNGDSFEGTYLGCKIGTNSFDPDKDTIHYKLKFSDGKETTMQTGSVKFAREMDKIKEGEKIRITRVGEGMKTKYEVEVLTKNGEPIPF